MTEKETDEKYLNSMRNIVTELRNEIELRQAMINFTMDKIRAHRRWTYEKGDPV